MYMDPTYERWYLAYDLNFAAADDLRTERHFPTDNTHTIRFVSPAMAYNCSIKLDPANIPD